MVSELHLLVTLSGVILDFELAPANATDLAIGEELLQAHTDLLVLADEGYVRQPVAEVPAFTRLVARFRHIVETVNGQPIEQFSIQKHYVHTFWGLCARLYAKLPPTPWAST